jgi:adenylosuccinate lyase
MINIPNVLAERYATKEIQNIWSQVGKIKLEREFWVAIMKSQIELGLDIPEGVVADYEKVIDQVDLDFIRKREAITRHDVKARIEAFCELAGHEHIHKGMTSRDLTENVEQLQVYKSIKIIQKKAITVLARLAEISKKYEDVLLTSRTHNVAAQPTTFGKRMSMYGEELLVAVNRMEFLINNYPVRGLKGAVGTQVDQLTLFDGDTEKVMQLEDKIIKHLGFSSVLKSVGQVYPRSLDFDVISALYQIGCAPSSFAKTLRLMAGYELASEGFAKGQVGSSAMPHKMNSRSCERINGFHTILRGYLTMAEGLAGDQWNEGDVSCSVVRRVMLPDAFFAIDGLLETMLTVLKQLQIFPAVIDKENQHYLPFLATTTFLMEAVKNGAGRETAHEAIKEHAVSTVLDLRNGTITKNNLIERLANDERLGLSKEQLTSIIDNADQLTGAASKQIETFNSDVQVWLDLYKDAASYTPGDIL